MTNLQAMKQARIFAERSGHLVDFIELKNAANNKKSIYRNGIAYNIFGGKKIKIIATKSEINSTPVARTEKLSKYTFRNGATVVAATIEEASEVIKRDYGCYLIVTKRES